MTLTLLCSYSMFTWDELTAIEVCISGNRVKMIKLLPYEKSLNVSFLKGIDNLQQDIEKHRSDSFPEKYLLSNRC